MFRYADYKFPPNLEVYKDWISKQYPDGNIDWEMEFGRLTNAMEQLLVDELTHPSSAALSLACICTNFANYLQEQHGTK